MIQCLNLEEWGSQKAFWNSDSLTFPVFFHLNTNEINSFLLTQKPQVNGPQPPGSNAWRSEVELM